MIRAVSWVVLGLVVFVHANDLAWRAPQIMSADGRGHFRKVGEVIQSGKDGEDADTVVADPDMLHTILLYYCFPQPLAMYRNCHWAGEPVHCRLGPRRFVSLTAMPGMKTGWEQVSLRGLQELRDRPFWFVYTDRFPNPPLLGHIHARCQPRGEWPPLTLFYCPVEAADD